MARIWIWAPVVRGPLFEDDDAGYHVQLNGPTTVNPLTGTVDPPHDAVSWYESTVPENRDSKTAEHGHCYVRHTKALIDEADRERCTNEVAEKDVPDEDRLMIELSLLEGNDLAIEGVFEREKLAATVITPDGKDMTERLLTQLKYRNLKPDAETRIRISLDLSPGELVK